MARDAYLRRVCCVLISVLIAGCFGDAIAQQLVDFSDWRTTTGFQGPRTSHAGVLVNNRVYILGGLAYTSKRPFRKSLSGAQFIEQCLGLFQVERVEAFGEPAVDRGKQFARLLHLALVAPEAGEAHCGAQLQRFRSLLMSGL